jgi:hypothetical protein
VWGSVWLVRWDRLFDDLEAQVAEIERDERDALVDELRDGDWAGTSWRQLLGGMVALEVVGAGRVEGEVALVNEHLVQLTGDRVDHVIAASAVTVVHAAERRADEPGRVASSLGWGHVFRALRDDGEPIAVRLLDGSTREGTVEVVGKDFVRLVTTSGRVQDVVWSAVAMVSGRR